VKPSTSIETLGDAIQFLSTLSAEVRSKPHWYRAIHSIGIAILEPRYVTLATLNLQLWRWTIYLQANRPAKLRLSPKLADQRVWLKSNESRHWVGTK